MASAHPPDRHLDWHHEISIIIIGCLCFRLTHFQQAIVIRAAKLYRCRRRRRLLTLS